MTAAFVYHLNAASPSVQSGRPHSILRNFQRLGVEVREHFPLEEVGVWQRKYQKIRSLMLHQRYLLDREESLLRSFANQLHVSLKETPANFVFSPSTLPLSYLETDLPVTFCADAPFCAMIDYYEAFTRLNPRQLALSEKLEARVIAQSALAVYPTQWAADQAIAHYGADPAKVAVIPFGANFGRDNRREDVWPWIEERAARDSVRLLFVGREWKRKGGNIVMATAEWLRARGLDVQVDVVGCVPPARYRHLDYLHTHGLLSARNQEQAKALTQLYQQAHFLFVPSRAEAYGMVFCEANAFGLPAISTATGGIPGVIRDGVNGFALPLEAGAECYGDAILKTLEPRGRYVEMAQNSFQEFEQRLNWESFSRSFLARVEAPPAKSKALPDGMHRALSPASAMEVPAYDPLPERPPEDSETTGTRPLRVAFVANEYFDPAQIGSWSGLPHFLWQALERQGLQLHRILLQSRRRQLWRLAKFGAIKLLTGRRYLRDRDPALLHSYARQIEEALAGQDYDFLFCPGTAPIACVKTEVPIAFWVDASFAGMKDFYESYTSLHPGSIRDGDDSDQAALDRAALAIYSSDWAADSVRRAYRVDPARLHVVRFGANLKNVPTTAEIHAAIDQRGRDVCRLLFIGVDWKRKGADIAVAALDELERLGVKAQLTIIGCQPPPGTRLPDNVKVLGFISKATEEGRQLIKQHLRESHFFFMPSRAEAYGLVFCESSAFGLPCVATDVGGVPSIVENGVNGWLLPADAPPAAYAERLHAMWQDPAIYEACARNGRRLYEERLNWDAAAQKTVGLMRRFLAAREVAVRNASAA